MGKNYSKDMSIEQILDKMDKSDGNTEIIHAGPCFLQYKLHQEIITKQNNNHKELLEEQRKFQKKHLGLTALLVSASWALVIVTLIVAFTKS